MTSPIFAKTQCELAKLFHVEINTSKPISDEHLSIIHYILCHTYEDNIHKMRGESENQVYYNPETGQEAVYDKNGKLVRNDYNRGSYNYAKYSEPFKKFSLDILPWLKWGNTRADPTTFGERLFAYIWDLDYGIQSYIFNQNKIPQITYKSLTEEEKQICHLFEQLIFNPDYEITFDKSNMEKLRTDDKYYFSYLDQIFEFMGY